MIGGPARTMRGRMMRITTRRAVIRRRRREEGQAMVEFAMILPLLLVVIVGIIKFGTVYNNYITLTNATRVGARELALGRGLQNPCTPAENRAIGSAASLKLTPSQLTLLIGASLCSSFPVPMTENVMLQGNQITFQAKYPCDLVILGINVYPGCELHASSSEAIE